MKRLALSLTLGLAALVSTPALALAGGGENWHADYDAAVEVAKKEGKNLLVDFTGSDWCGWCIRLNKEVFDHESWETAATKEYVLVALDFPRAEELKAKVPNPKRNQELAEELGVGGYPTILLMTPDGDVFGRTGYQAGGPEKYLEHMAELKKKGMPQLEAVLKLTKEYAAAEGDARLALWDKVADMLQKNGGDSAGARHLFKIVKEGLTLDPENKRGMAAKALKALFAAGRYTEENYAKAMQFDPKNESGLYELALLGRANGLRSREAAEGFVAAAQTFGKLGKVVDKAVAGEVFFAGAMISRQLQRDDAEVLELARWAEAQGATEDPRFGKMLKDLLASFEEEEPEEEPVIEEVEEEVGG